jgi:DNA-binding CsgD family transcriptional regulator
VPEPLVDTIVDAWLREVRGRLRHLAGDTDAAVCELREAGRMIGVFSQRGPMLTGWRRALVRILARLDPAAAMQLADEELADARRSLVPSWIGSALCTSAAAVATAQADAIKVLREATGVLATAPARYQYAVAVVDLGGALRRSGQRAEGRDVLREGLRLARLCGAVRLAERAEGELALAGARPRRDALSGVAALTAAELRVVRLAADGLTNRDIAQALFVNTNTVESHLYRAYPKLGIAGRTELANALRAAAG